MPAKVQDTDRLGEVVTALEKARDLIAARGYQPHFRGGRGDGPLNISNALTLACSDYDLYLLCRQSFSKNWGGPVAGLLDWETSKRRTPSEVSELFGAVLTRLENSEAHPRGLGSRGPSRNT